MKNGGCSISEGNMLGSMTGWTWPPGNMGANAMTSVQRFGGFVAKYMGDGILVYFGYPQAHEDDAERAVRAGLELIAAVSDLKTHAALQTRVGIATGLVVVGDLIGSGASQDQAIVGEMPNLSASLQRVAV